MNYEQQLLSRLAAAQDSNILTPIEEAIEYEQELARFYMPKLSAAASDKEILAWGKKFKETWSQRLEIFRNGTLV